MPKQKMLQSVCVPRRVLESLAEGIFLFKRQYLTKGHRISLLLRLLSTMPFQFSIYKQCQWAISLWSRWRYNCCSSADIENDIISEKTHIRALSLVIIALWESASIGKRSNPTEQTLESNGKKHKMLARLAHSFALSWLSFLLWGSLSPPRSPTPPGPLSFLQNDLWLNSEDLVWPLREVF